MDRGTLPDNGFVVHGDHGARVVVDIPRLPSLLRAADSPDGYVFLETEIDVRVFGFSGQHHITAVPQDFIGFLQALRTCQENLAGEALFSTLEDEFALKLYYHPNGRVTGDGYLRKHSEGNSLAFVVETDQTALAETFDQLEALCSRFEGFDY
jgi:hypothetical protein